MSNPLIDQGVLNRLRASVVVADDATLNVTAAFLGRAAINMALEGDATTMIPTQTGMVVSPEPYMSCMIKMHLLKSQTLAATYKSRMEANSRIGNITVRPDASTLPDYQIVNVAIVSVDPLSFAGADAEYVVTLRGSYFINNDLWNA